MDIRQSKQYANFMRSLGWKVERVGKWQAFIKPFPLIGSFIKIQRLGNPIPWEEIRQLSEKHRAYRVIIEPDTVVVELARHLTQAQQAAPLQQYKTSNSSYCPTKTIHINLSPSEETIFNRFNPATRRAVRRAMKNNVIVTESDNIESFTKLKTRYLFPMGFLMRGEIQKLWQSFQPNNAKLLLAYTATDNKENKNRNDNSYLQVKQFYSNNTYYWSIPIAGILLLLHRKTAYYWHACATPEGKKLFAPTLLVWEALKLAKKRGCIVFDFEGIYDERFPKDTKNWRGFTRFKSGFGGKEVIFNSPLKL